MKYVYAILFSVVFVFSGHTQKFKKKKPLIVRKDKKMSSRKSREMIDFNAYKHGGWYLSPGFTYTMNNEELLGGLGYYFEFGRFQIMYKGGRGLNYIDYSLAVKNLKKNPFKTHNAVAAFNFNNVYQFADRTFLQNSLGINVDYGFGGVGLPSNPLAQIHYKLGLGFKFGKRVFIIPSVETPILNAWQFDNFSSIIKYAGLRNRSLIFAVRIAWLQKQPAGYSCGKPGKKNKKLLPGNQDSKAQERYNNR